MANQLTFAIPLVFYLLNGDDDII